MKMFTYLELVQFSPAYQPLFFNKKVLTIIFILEQVINIIVIECSHVLSWFFSPAYQPLFVTKRSWPFIV